jgi:hypothetical protein
VRQEAVLGTAVSLSEQTAATGELTIRFVTPTRLEEGKSKRPLKAPDFGVFFRRLLWRIDNLAHQLADQPRREPEAVRHLYQLADQVRLVDANTRYLDLWNWSGRQQQKSPVGGFVGTATYRIPDWSYLLPWLSWGQAVQVGKLTIKGNGAYEMVTPDGSGYWQQLLS